MTIAVRGERRLGRPWLVPVDTEAAGGTPLRADTDRELDEVVPAGIAAVVDAVVFVGVVGVM